MTAAQPTVAIVGAGISGSLCAHRLAAEGFPVSVFDKGRGPGGRTATRRVDSCAFDHGAQYFTARDPRILEFVDRWLEAGVLANWTGTVAGLRAGVPSLLPAEPRYVGTPGMSAIARHLLSACEARFGVTAEAVHRRAGAWHVSFTDGSQEGPFDVVLVATPPAQALALAEGKTPLIEHARTAEMVPCWTTVMDLQDPIDLPIDGAFIQQGPLSFIVRDSSKPGRTSDADTWVLHATAEWSRAHLERSPGFVEVALHDAFEAAVGRTGMTPTHLLTHRWRYARPRRAHRFGMLYDPSSRIGFCGDWLTEGRVESAALSGLALADHVIQGAHA